MQISVSKALLGTAAALSFVASAAVADDWRAWNIHSDGHPNTAAMGFSMAVFWSPSQMPSNSCNWARLTSAISTLGRLDPS